MTKKDALLIIDGYGLVFRAYHVQPSLTCPDGRAVGAVYGFTNMLLKIINDFKPSHAIVVFDSGGKNFRHDIYPQYKAHRPSVHQDLIDQFALVRQAAISLNFATLERAGFEADDIIATLAHKASILKEEVIIITSDKDLMQLIDEYVRMYDPTKSKYISHDDVIEKFGVEPSKIREVMAFIGDASDNVPGVPSIGPKTAAELIKNFGTLENVLKSLDQIKSVKQREAINTHKDKALISWQLVELDRNVDIKLDLPSLRWNPPQLDQIRNFLDEFGFKSLNKRIEQLFKVNIIDEPPKKYVVGDNRPITFIKDQEHLSLILNNALESGQLIISLIKLKNKVIAIGLVIAQESYVIEIDQLKNIQLDFQFSSNSEWFIQNIAQILGNRAVKKITWNLKSIIDFFGTEVKGCDDIELMKYTGSAGLPQQNIFETTQTLTPSEIITHSMNIMQGFAKECEILTTQLLQNKLLALFKNIDIPLCFILYKMEQAGIRLDLEYLNKLSSEFASEITILEDQIYNYCDEQFNIASPKQLGEILFEKMKLPLSKASSKLKSYPTGADILEKLSEQGYEVADLLLRWRSLTKLKSTYTDSLQNHANQSTGRVHTTFLQNSTTTARLSSQNPNLQNIPIRSGEGNKIRAAFIASPNSKLISADYSQIELRILSHIADIASFKECFLTKEDVHTITAKKIFGLSNSELNADHRRKAKAINFGIIYGISAFGLARQLNISKDQAAAYITAYLEQYSGIKEYMETTKNFARQHGYVENLFGRRCYVPTILDKNFALRQFAERAAINAPIQGSNADIIKLAMINIDRSIKQQKLKTKLVLQIHDELLFETPEDEVDIVLPIIKFGMENAYQISVPLLVEAKVGNNWMEIH